MSKEKLLITLFIVIISLTGCNMQNTEEITQEETNNSNETTIDINQIQDINASPITDDPTIYAYDDPDSIVYFYVTVRKGVTGTETDHTFADVNSVLKYVDDAHLNTDVKADALVQVGDETGPLSQMLGYSITENNATIELRGNSTSVEPQKSYTLKLYDNTELWRGQEKIALVKSFYDSTRFRNKLYFDLLKDIPNIPTLRTQFVRLFIKDETSGESAYSDYGLYTQVETPNKKYLKNHALDGSGYLYKVRSFNFELDDAIKNFDDPEFNEEQFDLVLSCYGKEDNTKLIEMIQAINDSTENIDTVINTYFDRDNYLTWLAYNILMGDIDTTMQNFYLYSPINSSKWYFIPWDGDGCLMNYEYEVKGYNNVDNWEKGISNYWSVVLHERFLTIKDNRDQLSQKIEFLKNNYLTNENITRYITEYNKTIGSYPIQMPDLLHLSVTPDQRTDIINNLYNEIEDNYINYYQTLNNLMPFFLGEPIITNGNVKFTWDESYDMQGKLVNYSFYLSYDPDFSNIIVQKDNIRTFTADVEGLEQGQYYWKVIATSEDGRVATAFDQISVNDKYYKGMEGLVVE